MGVPGWWAGAAADAVTDTVTSSLGWLPDIGVGGLLALAIVLILTGRLVPAGELRADRDRWRNAYEAEAQKVRDLIDANRTTQDVLRALEQATKKDAAS